MKKLLVVACLLVACSISQGAVIVDYTFATADASANSSDTNVTAGSFLPVGPGLVGTAGRSSNTGGNMYARASGTFGSALSIGNAIASDDYLSVTIGANSGFGMDLDTLTFDYGYTRNGSFDGKQFKAYLLTSIDGFVDAGDIVGSKTINIGANTQTPPYTAVTIDLSGAQFQGITTDTEFRFYLSDTTGSADYIHRIDNVVLNGTVRIPVIETRTPASGSTNLPLTQTLDWELLTGGSVTDYVDVYFDTHPEPNLVDSGNFAGTYAPTLAYGTTYYWTLVTYDPNEGGTATPNPAEPVWSFTTADENPAITGDPVSQTVVAGTEVTLSVTAERANAYQWYQDGVEVTGATSSSLVLSSVQLADEGDYHCEAYNDVDPYPNAHPAAISFAARVMTKRLAGWWKLDGDLQDSVADVETGATAHDGVSTDPNYVTGLIGSGALAFSGADDPHELVEITGDPSFFNFYPQGYTFSAWVKLTDRGWLNVLAKKTPDTGFALNTANGVAIHAVEQSGIGTPPNDDRVVANGALIDDGVNWHLVTGSYDGTTGLVSIYVDGLLINSATGATGIDDNTASLVFGAMNMGSPGPSNRYYIGFLDEVKIYTYPITREEIAAEYQAEFPGTLCIYPDFIGSEYDVAGGPVDGEGNPTPDCQVSLPDFAEFVAGGWLTSGLYSAP